MGLLIAVIVAGMIGLSPAAHAQSRTWQPLPKNLESDCFDTMNPADGKTYLVQYFERNRFEHHPELAGTSHDVLLGLLGKQMTAERVGEAPFLPFTGDIRPDQLFFPETKHTLGKPFRGYWEQHGGLAMYGYPISEPFQEVNPDDGKPYTVQYFERARFEHHPEFNGTKHEVLLGLLGNALLREKGWR